MSHLESWECLACGEIIVQPDSVLAHNERKHMADVVAAVNTRATPEQRAHIERNYRRAADSIERLHDAWLDEQLKQPGMTDMRGMTGAQQDAALAVAQARRALLDKCDGDHGEPACLDGQCHLKGQPDYAYVLARRIGEQVELLCAHCALPLNAEPITTAGSKDDPAAVWHLVCAKEHAELKS